MKDLTKFFVKNFEILNDLIIKITFVDGKQQVVDFSKVYLRGPWEKLKDKDYFDKVKLNDGHNLEWPDGQDFKPEHLYYWDKYEEHYLPKK